MLIDLKIQVGDPIFQLKSKGVVVQKRLRRVETIRYKGLTLRSSKHKSSNSISRLSHQNHLFISLNENN